MKKRKTSFIVSLAVLLIIVGSVGVGLNFKKIKREILHYEETYATKNMDTMVIDIGNRGDATIHYTNDDEVQVLISGTNLDKTPIKTSYSKDDMRIIVNSTPPNFFDSFDFKFHFLFTEFGFNPTVKLDIYVPKSIQNIEVEGTNANLYVDAVSLKQMQIKTNSGDVDISSLNTDTLKIKSTSGNLSLTDITANKSTVETNSGNIYLNEVSGVIDGRTTSGNLNFENNTLKHSLDFKTHSGDIRLNLERAPNDATIKAQTSSGDIELGNSEYQTQKTFGKGTNKISLKTTSGDIYMNNEFNNDFDD